ncbi:polysaccharide biosynthesis/export family protein [Sinorhizobium sp. BG8]|uniref:polysaccharide biosynthesis/export family protein n=1 Tax=Sinorhizobium sp. BG8 TaxID=2613773 RepID=UPI00193E184D|nr:polysaccharide biosynthesis/export family protein [Sinorhizobium sp. BG8]
MTAYCSTRRAPPRRTLRVVAFLVACGFASPLLAASTHFPPQTKIRLTIVQWMPTKGAYEQWGALGGDYVVSEAGTISLPVLGTVDLGDLDDTALGKEIARRLQARIGLVETPEATVQVLSYPPIYVIGDVSTPGQFEFRTGMTVLQALAMSGGEAQDKNSLSRSQEIELIGELRSIDANVLRGSIRIARLQAEISGAKEIEFTLPIGTDRRVAEAILEQEEAIFSARRNDLERQSKSLTELRKLLDAELVSLGEKAKGVDANASSLEKELANVKTMVERGLTIPSRQAELERTLRGIRSDQLDLVTATMRARQSIAETTRDLDGLYDKRHTEIASELQTELSALDQQELKRETTQKKLLDGLAEGGGSTSREKRPLIFAVTRRIDSKTNEFPATEMTLLIPGDVVRVTQVPLEATQFDTEETDVSVSPTPRSQEASQ